jgi:hypothetical protein
VSLAGRREQCLWIVVESGNSFGKVRGVILPRLVHDFEGGAQKRRSEFRDQSLEGVGVSVDALVGTAFQPTRRACLVA